jgi:8-oxo-dGTP diphosphatase
MNHHDQPLIAVDVVPVTFSATDGLLFGTALREFDPWAGTPALPGVLLGAGERLHDAAFRALRTKAGVGPDSVRHLAQLGAFDAVGRDPRSNAISISFLTVVDPGAGAQIDWASASDLPSTPFDHDAIIQSARKHLSTYLWTDADLTRALTGTHFTTVDAARIGTDVLGAQPHAGNLHRALSRDVRLERTETTDFSRSAGRPPSAWKWND